MTEREAWDRLTVQWQRDYGAIPTGPSGVVARILIRTRKYKYWEDPAMMAVALASHGRKRRHA